MEVRNRGALKLGLGLLKPQRDAIHVVYPDGWREHGSPEVIDTLAFVDGLRLMGLSEAKRVAVMQVFKSKGLLAARLEAGQYLNSAFMPLFEDT